MNFLKITLISLLTFVYSCNEKHIVHFRITNNSEFALDSLQVDAWDTIQRESINIPSHSEVFYDLEMDEIKGDGYFIIQYYMGEKFNHKEFGYYSTGISLEDSIQIIIENDTTLIKYLN